MTITSTTTTPHPDVSPPSRIIGPDMPGEPADEREKFTRITEGYPDEEAEAARRAFLLSKLHSARTHPVGDLDDRERMVAAVAERLGLDERAKEAEEEEAGGGIGYGLLYNEGFRRALATGTSLSWDIICPDRPGGNVDSHLRVTAMNRAALGPEAFVSYYAQREPRFRLFDWARPAAPWRLDLPWSLMAPYLRSVPFHGAVRQLLGLTATTVELFPGTWRNTVHLWNSPAGRNDLAYLFDYPATLAQQIAVGYRGSWGPTIETGRPAHSGTEPMGALATSLTARNHGGIWAPWAFLGRYDSHVRTDNLGFVVEFLDPNHNFAVKS
ncbi:hypothetical protein ABTX80_32755 [Streptomyces erythrochromogenes]|uniref:hypothetical protein n=1 Tax=Streptomyces erythrochromogenes TaxID=285574 RepID=UPI0033219E4E